MKNTIVNVLVALSVALLIWIGVSFIDVVKDNNSPDPVHSEYNFFEVIVD